MYMSSFLKAVILCMYLLLSTSTYFAEGAPVNQARKFADPNFKLVVMDALMTEGIIDLGEWHEFLSRVLNKPVDDPYELGFKLIQPAHDHLVNYPLTKEQLAQVKNLSFDGGLDIYTFAHPTWDGESEIFDIKSVEGIHLLKNLKAFEVSSMLTRVDLNHLKGLDKLENVDLGVPVKNLSALLALPALKKVSILSDQEFKNVSTIGHPTRKIFEKLKKRGVKVGVHWMTWVGENKPKAFE